MREVLGTTLRVCVLLRVSLVLPAGIVLLGVGHLYRLIFVVHEDAPHSILLLLHDIEKLLLLLDVRVWVARVLGVDYRAQLLASSGLSDLAEGWISSLSGLNLCDGELIRFAFPAGVLAIKVLQLTIVDAPSRLKRCDRRLLARVGGRVVHPELVLELLKLLLLFFYVLLLCCQQGYDLLRYRSPAHTVRVLGELFHHFFVELVG